MVVVAERARGVDRQPEKSPRWRNLYIHVDKSTLPGQLIHPTKAAAKQRAYEFFCELCAWIRENGCPPADEFPYRAIQIPEPEWPFFF